MNLRTAVRPEWRGEPEALTGPGIYGVFLDGSLFYIGLYAGKACRPFGGSVLERWSKHATYHILRAPEVVFAKSQLDRIIAELTGPAADIAACVAQETDAAKSPLLEKHGGSCTFNKARFAARHWETLGPGKEETLLARISFVYHQLSRSWATRRETVDGEGGSRWVKRHWLRPAEKALIEAFNPICNGETTPGSERDGIGPDEVEKMMAALFGDDGDTRHVSENDGADLGNEGTSLDTSTAKDDDDATDGERKFRARLSTDGAALVEELSTRCPRSMTIGFTDTPDLRIYVNQPRRRVLLTMSTCADGQIACHTLASVAVCRALGFDAKEERGGPMKAGFTLDSRAVDVTDLVAVGGAAVQPLDV
ncbi:hypothetical protein [Sphingomonas sp. ZB1N12]|uniref:hypothetical protein n=2 Tax=Sphingomonadaceae TaxID=41297 RepID=UPI002FCB411F